MCVDVLVNRVTQPAVLQPRCVNPHCKPWRVKENHTFTEYNLKGSFYGYLCIGVLLRPDIKRALRLWAALAPDGCGEVTVPAPASQEDLPPEMPVLTYTILIGWKWPKEASALGMF